MAKCTIFNMDCVKALERMPDESISCVVTSPPYATNCHTGWSHPKGLYDVHKDIYNAEAYNDMCVALFNGLGRKLKRTGVVCWNCSYNKSNNEGFLWAICEIISKTNFTIADVISWKKQMAVTVDSPNRLTRICEQIYVLCRRDGYEDFICNKPVSSVFNGRNKYGAVFNFIETKKNDDAKQDLNGATFPSELVAKLLDVYLQKNGGGYVYDPFMGTGTTGYAACGIGVDSFGSEISAAQCDYAKNRIDDMFNQCEIVRE